VIPLSLGFAGSGATHGKFSGTTLAGSGDIDGGGGVGGTEIAGGAGLERDLNENFCLGAIFDFSADNKSDNCFSC